MTQTLGEKVDLVIDKLNQLLEHFKEVEINAYIKSPHKCPVCDGEGKRTGFLTPFECRTCTGKGIVWG